ncbi:MAG: hypothetical protein ACI9FR_001133 [Cryomorphaceae bacterium]|jgi:uncharacterized protein YhdP
MIILRRLIIILLASYVLFWSSLAAYFTYAGHQKGLLESNLSRFFDRPVTIQKFKTVWGGISPRVQIKGFEVKGDVEGEPAFAFQSLSAELSPLSLLSLWPRFTEFALERPSVEIVSLSNNQLQIAGIRLGTKRKQSFDPQRLVSWLMDQESAVWLNGEIVWRRIDGENQRFRDISFVYQREQQNRLVNAAITTPKGAMAFKVAANGDLFSSDNWDAEFEVLGNQGERLLSADDLSLNVVDGKGQLRLKTLDVARIRDLIRLTGLADRTGWLLDAQLTGRLHDLELDFSGSLLNINEWNLQAAASDVGFKSIRRVPALNNLSGSLSASAGKGSFLFAAKDSVFEWSRWFDQGFPIDRAQGEFSWQIESDGEIILELKDGEFEDRNARIFNLNASCRVDQRARTISSFAQLFKVGSVADLTYEDGELVDVKVVDGAPSGPLLLDASAEFELSDLTAVHGYLPNDPRIEKFREWWERGVISGSGTNGRVRYQGEVSKTALYTKSASLLATADFNDVEMDYGYQRDWPILKNGAAAVVLRDDVLTISPSSAQILGQPIVNSEVKIKSLFKLERSLELKGEITVGLTEGMDFLFKGPLIEPTRRPKVLPIVGKSGTVSINTQLILPLSKVSDAKVVGQAVISNGVAILPEGVPVSDIYAKVEFTERRVTSEDIRATFLGSATQAKLLTVQEAQPPVMKLVASGQADMERLEPWVGEHLLTWFSGRTPWQGAVLIDGPRVEITGVSDMHGVTVTAPAPLSKRASEPGLFSLSMVLGDGQTSQQLNVEYNDFMLARMRSNPGVSGSLFDNALISVGGKPEAPIPEGVNFEIHHDGINVDDWLEAVIDIAQYETNNPAQNDDFINAMRSVKITAGSSFCLARDFGTLGVSAVSVDGFNWIGTLNGENIKGTLNMQPRADISNFDLNLSYLNLGEEPPSDAPPEPIDYSLQPQVYPSLSLNIDKFVLTGKSLGRLELRGEPVGDAWEVTKLDLTHNGIRTTASGKWVNDKADGSISAFDFNTDIDEAEGVLDDMEFDGFVRKGKGSVNGKLKWIGAPHEFDYARLNGNFDMRIKDGELVKVEPGGGKLLGLLNFNAIARRLAFDFRDVFASGLKFDRMQYTGLFADGEAVMREAYIFTPAVFVSMEGKVDLDKELIDMEIHMSPELGGNLTLLSALANPAAGAVLFITQQLFKDEMRKSSFKSYRALGTWEDFEMVEFEPNDESQVNAVSPSSGQ